MGEREFNRDGVHVIERRKAMRNRSGPDELGEGTTILVPGLYFALVLLFMLTSRLCLAAMAALIHYIASAHVVTFLPSSCFSYLFALCTRALALCP